MPNEEVKQEEVVTIAEEVKEVPAGEQPQEEESQDKINWRRFREAREKERKEKIAIEKRAQEKEAEVTALKAAMEALVNKPDQRERYAEEPQEENDDQRIRRLVAETIESTRQKDLMERERKAIETLPTDLKRSYPDFDAVCTTENLDYIDYHYPEISETLKTLPDNFDKWSRVYGMVKKLIPNLNAKKDQAKAERNFMKPQSMSVGGKTQVGDTAPTYVDDKRKNDNWARMQRVMKGGAN
jgi:hypothetical protein